MWSIGFGWLGPPTKVVTHVSAKPVEVRHFPWGVGGPSLCLCDPWHHGRCWHLGQIEQRTAATSALAVALLRAELRVHDAC
jgi:hypothetical protein